MSWFRSEIDGHERRVVFIRSHDLPLDRDTAIDDLRIWQDRVMAPGQSLESWPSSKWFGERWGWPKTSAYRLMIDAAAWSDPSRLDEWRRRWNDHGTELERRRNARGTKRHGPTPENPETRNDVGTELERERNESGHRRGDPPSPSPSTSDQKSARTDATLLPGDRLPLHVDHAAEINACIDLAETVGAPVLADDHRAIRASGFTVLELGLIWAWFHASGDDQARLAHESGWVDSWKSLLRSGRKWLTKAKQWHVAGRPTGPPTRAAPRSRGSDRPTHLSAIADIPD